MKQRGRFGWFFFVPTLVVLGFGNSGNDGKPSGLHLLVTALVCVAAGAAWQLLDRRDLTDRLTYFAGFFVGCMIVFAIRWDEQLTRIQTPLAVGVGAVITGCVLGEQLVRLTAAPRGRRSRTGVSVPA